jgi:uncharacterized protein
MPGSGVVTAQWRDLLMVSYEVDPLLLVPLVPSGTSLDFHGGRSLVTLVGWCVDNLQVAGLPVSIAPAFEQLTLRSYVWRQVGAEMRPGVVFLKRIVSTTALASGASALLSEPYLPAPMHHSAIAGDGGGVAYGWFHGGRWNRLSARRAGPARVPDGQSIEAFVTDRHWSYDRQADGSTREYEVGYPAWTVAAASNPRLDCDIASAFGAAFTPVLSRPPLSAVVATGSAVVLHPGRIAD